MHNTKYHQNKSLRLFSSYMKKNKHIQCKSIHWRYKIGEIPSQSGLSISTSIHSNNTIHNTQRRRSNFVIFLHLNVKIAENCVKNLDCNNNNNEQTKTSIHKTRKFLFYEAFLLLTYAAKKTERNSSF